MRHVDWLIGVCKYETQTHIASVLLHHENSVTSRHQFFKDCREVLRHLLERQLDRFKLALVKVVDQIFDGLLQTVT